MSSAYRILCLSHDPAIVVNDPGYQRAEDAEAAIRDRPEGAAHSHCDLVIGRYSYPLVEVGCPRSADQPEHLRPGVLRCYHGSTMWTSKEWLLLLGAAYQSDDPAVREAVKAGNYSCLPWERLRRLRVELGITVTKAALGVGDAEPALDIACAAYQPPAMASDSGLCARCGMSDYKHSGRPDA